MKDFQDIVISSKSLSAREILNKIQDFARVTQGWADLPDKSKEYALFLSGEPACIIHALATQITESAAVALTSNSKKSVVVTNIVPETKSQLNIDEYNLIAQRFKNELFEYIRLNGNDIRIRMTTGELRLEYIIRGKKTRKLFQNYLNSYPKSWHPLDITRLDTFICSVSRYGSNVDLERLYGFLINNLGWSQEDACRCCERIKIGCQVLEANRRF
jgi:hypothetical protein